MVRHEHSILIKAPVEEVFAYVNDANSLPEWMIGMIEIRDPAGSGEGLQYEWTYKMAGLQLRGQNVVVEYVPNEKATHQSIGMVESEWTNRVKPVDGGTELSIEVEYTLPLAVLGKLAEHLTVRRNQREMELSLLSLKENLEPWSKNPR
jgi:uncharacterized membrane protein